MSKQRTNKSQNNDDPDFNLDKYLSEQSYQSQQNEPIDSETESSSFSRNLILICAVSAASFLWYFDWSPRNAYNFFFADDATIVANAPRTGGINVQIPPINIEIPDINIDIPEIVGQIQSGTSTLNMSFTDYMAELNELGYLDPVW